MEQTAQKVWSAALGELQLELTRHNYDTWLKEAVAVCLEGDTLTVAVPTEFHRQHLSERLAGPICRALAKANGRTLTLRYELTAPSQPPVSLAGGEVSQAPSAASVLKAPRLNRRYRFDTWVVGEANRMAFSCARAAASGMCLRSPLYVQAKSGNGKTHLLHAIGHGAREAGLRVMLMSGSDFVGEYSRASSLKQWDRFFERFEETDILLLDEVDFIQKKKHSEEAFFQIFRRLYDDDRTIVVTAEVLPKDLADFPLKLRSRLSMGVVASIDEPDSDLRFAIAVRKALEQGGHLPEEAAKALAAWRFESVRDLEGVVNNILTQREVKGSIESSDVTKALREMTGAAAGPPGPERILQAVADHYAVRPEALGGQSRRRGISRPRHIAAYLLHSEAGLSFADCGRLLGGRDRSTISQACEGIRSELEARGQAEEDIEAIRRRLRSA